MDFNNKVMETLTAITENNEEDKQDLANLKQSLIDGTFNVKYLTWAIMATNDENGNRIIDTYATIERLTQVLEALTQEISDRKAADDLEKKERKEETSAIINSVNQEISDRTNAVSVLNNLITAETENRTSEDEKVLQYAQSVNEALGNAKTDLQGKIDSEAQTRLANDNEIKASITSKEDSLKALINSVKNELNGYITTLNNRVNNLPTNYVFDTYESMKNDLLNASNTKYKVGDTLFIKEVNKPDYWVSAILSTKGTYGYYELSEQESKVDLSNYVKISELSREAIEEKFLETLENGITKSFASSSFTATDRNSGIDINNYAQYCADGVSFHKNGMEYPIAFPQKDGTFALISDIPQALKNPFALTINGKVYDGSSAVEVITETITEHDFVRFWHDGIEIQNDGTNNILRFSAFDTELEEFSPHISCQYDGPQYYWLWKFPKISGTFAMESQIPTKLSQLTNDGNYQTNTSDLKDNTTTFTTASTRSNVASGEKLSVSFGKIAKYFNDLKAVAFSGNKADIGLGNVDNTSDADKPVSNATQQALNLKANSSDVYTKTETDGLLNNKANKSDVYTKAETDGLLNDKANTNNVYTKSETDAGLNKSLYNLGYYDTMVENSDGTYTITRQTGYLVLDGSEDGWGIYTQGLWAYIKVYNIIPETNQNNVGQFITNRGPAVSITTMINTSSGIQIALGGESINIRPNVSSINSLDTFKQWLSQNNITIQYKLATATTEKVEANHYARYNERFILEHNKSEAERSANLLPNSANRNLSGDTYFNLDLSNYVNKQIIFSLTNNEQNPLFVIRHSDGSSKDIFKNSVYTVLSGDKFERIYSSNSFTTNIMLNVGSIALPYQPYEGKVVHEKELGEYVTTDTNQIISGLKTFKGNEHNDISFVYNNDGAITNFYHVNTAIRHALQFPWYNDIFQIGNVRGGGTDSFGFGVTKGNNQLIALFQDTSTAYIGTNTIIHSGNIGSHLKTINGDSIVGSGDLAITPGIFTKLGNKTNFSFDSGSYLVVANNGLVDVTGTDPLNVGSSGNKKFVGIFMVTIASYGGGQSVCVNTEEVFSGEAASATISGPMFTIYRLN